MDQNIQNAHVKFLAFDLVSLVQIQSHTEPLISFTRRGGGIAFSRAEILGVVTAIDHKPNKFLKFIVDDGTGCVTCLLWLNSSSNTYLSRRSPLDVRLIADVANHLASLIKIGIVARVRGRITSYRGAVQISASDVVIERDPNAEIFHWLNCLRIHRLFATMNTSSNSSSISLFDPWLLKPWQKMKLIRVYMVPALG